MSKNFPFFQSYFFWQSPFSFKNTCCNLGWEKIKALHSINSFDSSAKYPKLSQKWMFKNFENSGVFSTVNERSKVDGRMSIVEFPGISFVIFNPFWLIFPNLTKNQAKLTKNHPENVKNVPSIFDRYRPMSKMSKI